MKLTESISVAEIESQFRHWANVVWKGSKLLSQINFSFLLVPNKEMKGKVLMSIAYASKPWAMGDSLIQVPKTMTVRINDRLFELPPDKITKIVIHEVVHIGYSGHDQKFISLCSKHGGAPSELSASEEGYKVQVKQGSRYVTVKTFPLTSIGQEQARIFGREEIRKQPGLKARIVI